MIAPPESCVSTMRGLIGVPTSATLTSRVMLHAAGLGIDLELRRRVAPTIQNGVALSVWPFSSGGV